MKFIALYMIIHHEIRTYYYHANIHMHVAARPDVMQARCHNTLLGLRMKYANSRANGLGDIWTDH